MKYRTQLFLESLSKPFAGFLIVVVLLTIVSYGYQRVRASIGKTTGSSFANNSGFKVRQPTSVSGENLAAYYPLDGNANDAVLIGKNNLTASASVTSGSGKMGNAASFSASQKLSAATNSVMEYGGTGKSFTFAAWVYLNSASNYHTILSKYNNDSPAEQREYYLGCNETNCTNIAWQVYNTANCSGSACGSTTKALGGTGAWKFVVADFDVSTGNISLDVNNSGTPGTSTMVGTLSTASAATFKIGNYFSSDGFYWNGKIDSVGAWQRLLSSDEKAILYSGGTGRSYSSLPPDLRQGLVSWWDLEEGGSSTRIDSIKQSSNNGTVTGATSISDAKFALAYSFDGNDYISTASIAAASTISESFWIKTTGTAGYPIYWGANRYCKISSNLLVCPVDGSDAGAADSDNAINDGLWHHVVLSSTASAQTMYVDGVAQTTTGAETLNTTAAALYMGSDSTPANYFTGTLDDVRIFSTNLSVSQAATLYGGSLPPNCDQSCKAWWKQDDTTLTSGTTSAVNLGSSYDHTLTDNTVGNAAGKIGNAGDFDPANSEYLSRADTSTLSFNATNPTVRDVSIAVWIYVDNIPAGTYPNGYRAVLGKDGAAAGTREYSVFLSNQNCAGCLSFIVSTNGTNIWEAKSTTSLSTGTWYFVAAWTDFAANKAYISVNNGTAEFVGNIDSGESTYDGTAEFRIGDAFDGSVTPKYWDGRIDEVGLWERALTSGEITSLYNSGVGKTLTSLTAAEQVGLVSWWTMEEASGSRYDSRFRTAITGATASEGIYKGGFNFDGTDDIAAQIDPAVLDMGAAQDFSVSGWFNRDSFTTDDTIFAKRASITASDVGYLAYIDDSDDKFYFEASDGIDEYSLSSSTAYISDGWHHFTVSWDDDGTPKLYIDGKDETNASGTLASIGDLSNTQQFAMGAESDVGNPFDGRLDDIRVYNRALASHEIAEQHVAGRQN